MEVRKPPVTYSFKVLQAIEKRVGAKLVAEMMENVTTPDQYEFCLLYTSCASLGVIENEK